MPLRNAKPFAWRPAGCTDAADGADSFDGAMASLRNLVPSPKTQHQWVARPGATSLVTISAGNQISAGLVVGTTFYGMVANGLGQDVPFAYSISSNTLLPISGVNLSINAPITQPTTGDIVQPILSQVGSRVLVTHPGFSNTAISAARAASFTGTGLSGAVNGYTSYTLAQVGDIVTGPGVPSNSTILAITLAQGQTLPAFGANGLIGANTINFSPTSVSGNQLFPGFSIFDNSNIGIRGTVLAVSQNIITWSGNNPNTFTGATLYWGGDQMLISQVFTTGATLTVSGITATGSPWQSVGPQAPTGASYKFGWFDISGASIQYTAAITSGSPIISLTTAFGVQPGLLVSGTGLAATTTLINLSQPSLNFIGTPPNFGDISLTVQFNASAASSGVVSIPLPGMIVTGPGIAPGTVVAAAPTILGLSQAIGTVQVPLSIAAPGTVGLNTGSYLFTGLVVGVLAANATQTNSAVTLTFTGGTPTNPLWYAGDTSYTPLPSRPVSVAQLAGRAYFACQTNGIPFSDSGLSCQRTYPSQALAPMDGLAINALGELPLLSPITGGIVQAIIAFAGVKAMYQITGDIATNNLSLNKMNIATGTHAPLSIIGTNFGLAFISPEGMRIVDFSGRISDPIGDPGSTKQIAFPFVSAQFPTRICGAATADTIRWTVNNSVSGQIEDWCYDISRKQFHGPHTFVYSIIQPFKEFFIAQADPSLGAPGTLFDVSVTPVSGANINALPIIYSDNGNAIVYNTRTVLLPENPEQNALRLAEASIFFGANPINNYMVQLLDETGTPILTQTMLTTDTSAYQRMVRFDLSQIDVFTQVQMRIHGTADASTLIGRILLKYQDLGYQRYIGNILLPPPSGGEMAVLYSVSTGISAGGTTQGTATPLVSQDNEVTTGTSLQGVLITINTPGSPTIVHNYTGANIYVYPPFGGQINKIGTNTPYLMVDGSSMEFHCMSATQWYSTSP